MYISKILNIIILIEGDNKFEKYQAIFCDYKPSPTQTEHWTCIHTKLQTHRNLVEANMHIYTQTDGHPTGIMKSQQSLQNK